MRKLNKETERGGEVVREYEMLCKNVVLAEFTIKSAMVNTCDIVGPEELLPMYMRYGNPAVGLNTFLMNRHLDFDRTNARVLLRELGMIRGKSVLNVLTNMSLCLTDCFWTRELGSDDIFEEVSLYRKRESKFIVDVALNGLSDIAGRFERSAEITNIGSFEKAWKYVENEWRLYKRGSPYNNYAELFYCRLAEYLGVPCARYAYDKVLEMMYSVNITNESVMLEHGDSAKFVVDGEDFHMMHYLDAITYNYDRHEFNWGVLRSADTGEILGFSEIFDNNLCLGVDGDGGNKGPLGTALLSQLNLPVCHSLITMEVIWELDRQVKTELGLNDLDTSRQMRHWEEVIRLHR